MLIKTNIKIIHIEEVSAKVLQLNFNVTWTIDDTSAVVAFILQQLSAQVIECVKGADIYCVRIKYGDNEFLLNFEEYSHACWLECTTAQDIAALQDIKRLLK